MPRKTGVIFPGSGQFLTRKSENKPWQKIVLSSRCASLPGLEDGTIRRGWSKSFFDYQLQELPVKRTGQKMSSVSQGQILTDQLHEFWKPYLHSESVVKSVPRWLILESGNDDIVSIFRHIDNWQFAVYCFLSVVGNKFLNVSKAFTIRLVWSQVSKMSQPFWGANEI